MTTDKKAVEEFSPPDWGGGDSAAPLEGLYIWALRSTKAEFVDTQSDKPYAKIALKIESTDARPSDHAGFEFDYRLYLTSKAEKWARWFLSKFGYPEELLNATPTPILRRQELLGLSGEAICEVSLNNMNYLNFDLKGFQRHGEDILDKKLEQLKAEAGASGEREIDVNADVKQQQKKAAPAARPKTAESSPLDALDDDEPGSEGGAGVL